MSTHSSGIPLGRGSAAPTPRDAPHFTPARSSDPYAPAGAAIESDLSTTPSRNSNVSPLFVSSKKHSKRVLDVGTVTLLQTVLQFIHPLDSLRYKRSAMALSYRGSVIIDGDGAAHTFGGAPKLRNLKGVKFVDCACGDYFVSLLSDSGEVWVGGNLEGDQMYMPEDPDAPQPLHSMASNVSMVAASITRLFCLTNTFAIQPLTNTAVNTVSMHPARLCKYLCLGLNDDVMMIGHDNVLYKVTASRRAVSTPRRVMSLANIGVSRVASGHGFHFVIDLAGRLYTYGRNRKGQLGNGEIQDSMRSPFLHRELLKYYVVNVSAGENHGLVLTSDGHVFGAGSSRDGELGLGAGPSLAEITTMTKVPLPGPCVGIEAGPTGSFFAMADGSILSCGSNECGQLGVPKARVVPTPTKVDMPLLSGRGAFPRVVCRQRGPSVTRRDASGSISSRDGTESMSNATPFGGPTDPFGSDPYENDRKTKGCCECCAVS